MTGFLPTVTELQRGRRGSRLAFASMSSSKLHAALTTLTVHLLRTACIAMPSHNYLLLQRLPDRELSTSWFVFLKGIFWRCNSLSQSSAPLLFSLGPVKWLLLRRGERRASAINKNILLELEIWFKHWLRGLDSFLRKDQGLCLSTHMIAPENPTPLYRHTCRPDT